MPEYHHLIHPISPFYDQNSNILILGSFPSPKSRESGFFYGHPQNRFWKVMAGLFQDKTASTVPEKQAFLKRHHIACWDSIHACDIVGASDASIKNAVPNDLNLILHSAPIRAVYTNGKKSHEIYQKYCLPLTNRQDICLPSTSPANAAWSLEKLTKAWRRILTDC